MHVVVVSEGNSDARIGFWESTSGAISVLLQRVLADALGREPSTIHVEGQRLPRLQRGSGFERKVNLAVARYDGKTDGLAIVIDRDGPENRDRIRLLEQGRDASTYSLAARTAVGVAVEMMEAWLLADTGALSRILDVHGAQPEPESIADPKSMLCDMAQDAGKSSSECVEQIAANLDLQVLQNRCRAFEDFARRRVQLVDCLRSTMLVS